MNSVENKWFWYLILNYACDAMKWNYSTIELAARLLWVICLLIITAVSKLGIGDTLKYRNLQ